MAWLIECGEPVHDAIVRLMREQLERAHAQLTDPTRSLEDRIHDARRRFKECRALLRLVREPLGERFRTENAWIRDSGRELSGARDAQAVLEALERLASATRIPARTLKKARTTLAARASGASEDLALPIDTVTSRLEGAAGRLEEWPQLGGTFAAIGPGLRRTYRDGRRCLARVRRAPAPREFHEWRKRVKDHWYQLQLLRDSWPSLMTVWLKELKELSRLLGEHHDLFVLRGLIVSSPAGFGGTVSAVRLLDIIDDHQRELAASAVAAGLRLYAEPPDAWLDRTRRYWTAWRAG